jgi:hypothetical protein
LFWRSSINRSKSGSTPHRISKSESS